MKDYAYNCIFCGSNDLEELPNPYISQQLWPCGNRRLIDLSGKQIVRVICRKCGAIQFVQNNDYIECVDDIFSKYEFIPEKIFGKGESETVVGEISNKIVKCLELSSKGKILDLGCAAGDFLTNFQKNMPDWELYGMDIDEHNRGFLMQRRIKYFPSLREVKTFEMKYDLITMNSTLCIVDKPREFLQFMKDKLSDKGCGVIIDTDYTKYIFGSCCIENRSLITENFICSYLDKLGFEIVSRILDEGRKKFGFVFKKLDEKKCSYEKKVTSTAYDLNKKIYESNLHSLNYMKEKISNSLIKNNQGSIGIMGTSIGGLWCLSTIRGMNKNRKIIFIDEDDDMIGKILYDSPVIHPREIDDDMIVFMPFGLGLAEEITHRLKHVYGLTRTNFILL